jgi:hypothetical protein
MAIIDSLTPAVLEEADDKAAGDEEAGLDDREEWLEPLGQAELAGLYEKDDRKVNPYGLGYCVEDDSQES